MLTFKKDKNKIVANVVEGKKTTSIYIKETFDNKEKPQIETSDENKKEVFQDYLSNLKRPISKKEKDLLIICYDDNTEADKLNGKLYKIFEDGLEFVNNSLKKYLNFKSNIVYPKINTDYFSCFVSGMSGSGKSYYISEFIYNNRDLIPKGAGIFLIGPCDNDESFKKIFKNLIYIDIPAYEKENKEDFNIKSIPIGSVIIFDDTEAMANNKYVESIRDKMLADYRKRKLKILSVSHVALDAKKTSKVILESQYFIVFKNNWMHASNLLSTYAGLKQSQLDLLYSQT